MAADGGGGIVAPNLFPMLINEHGGRRNRLCELMQPLLLPDTNVSGSRYERLWEQTRTHAGRDTIARGAAFAGKSVSAFAEEKAGFVDFIFQRDV